ncbi:extensin-like [Manacus vitellinus]|uniref:extensin-like n=1 Tax=Manacus vitellinus TaxID=328815 RepID=UPI00115F10F9|nr:extensin-like [Manacus vitellinus]
MTAIGQRLGRHFPCSSRPLPLPAAAPAAAAPPPPSPQGSPGRPSRARRPPALSGSGPNEERSDVPRHASRTQRSAAQPFRVTTWQATFPHQGAAPPVPPPRTARPASRTAHVPPQHRPSRSRTGRPAQTPPFPPHVPRPFRLNNPPFHLKAPPLPPQVTASGTAPPFHLHSGSSRPSTPQAQPPPRGRPRLFPLFPPQAYPFSPLPPQRSHFPPQARLFPPQARLFTALRHTPFHLSRLRDRPSRLSRLRHGSSRLRHCPVPPVPHTIPPFIF